MLRAGDAGCFPLSLESKDVQASVAALLAPGPSGGLLGCLLRVDFELLSFIILGPRRVVLMVCRPGRSGLGEREGLACGTGGGGIEGAVGGIVLGP